MAHSFAMYEEHSSGHYFAQRRHDSALSNGGALVRVGQNEAGIGRAAAGLQEWASNEVPWH